MAERTYEFVRDDSGLVHVKTDAPGERATSAPIPDPMDAIQELAEAAQIAIETSPDGQAFTIRVGDQPTA